MPKDDPSDRNLLLDNLRGLAILGVLAVHSVYTVNTFTPHGDNDYFTYMMGLGKYGVELFFFISGALMFSIYGLSGSLKERRFWLRRILRIYPLWIFFLLMWMILGFQFDFGGVHSILESETGLNQFSHSFGGIFIFGSTFTLFLSAPLWNTVIPGGWSIQAEMFHYFCFAVLRKIKLEILLLSLSFMNFATLVIQSLYSPDNSPGSIPAVLIESWIRSGFYSSLSFFTLGILFGLISQNNSTYSMRDTLSGALGNKHWTLAFFLLSIFLIPTPFGYTVEAFGYVLIMVCVGWIGLSMKSVSKSLSYLGKYSYFVYFVHFLILDLLVKFTKTLNFDTSFEQSQKIFFFVFYVLTLFFSIVCAIPSMRYFEGPLMRMARRKSE
jgi:peptidoglycan/LPS O-acetylase OafA/YrhL